MLNRPITILDDRRASVSLLRLRRFRAAAEERPEGHARDAARALARRLGSFMLARGRRLTFGGIINELLLGASVLVAVLMPIFFFGIVGPLALLGIVFGVPAAFSYFSRETGERKLRHELAASYVAEGICGSCAYPLQGLATDDDGCHVCPECGAAWLAQRITAPLWDPDRPTLPDDLPALRRLVRSVPRAAMRTAGDARARLVPVADPALTAWPDSHDDADLAPIRRALRRLNLTWRLVVVIAAAIPLSLATGLAFVVLREPGPAGLFGLAAIVLLLGVGLNLVLAPLRGSMLRGPRRVAPVILRFARCPTCGTHLRHARRTADGLLICTTCAATWKPPSPH